MMKNRRNFLKGVGIGTGVLGLPATVTAARDDPETADYDTASVDGMEVELPEDPVDPVPVNPGTRYSNTISEASGSDTETSGFGNANASVDELSFNLNTFAAGAGASQDVISAAVAFVDFELRDWHDEPQDASIWLSYDWEWESDVCGIMPTGSDSEEKTQEQEDDTYDSDDVTPDVSPKIAIELAKLLGDALIDADAESEIAVGLMETNYEGKFTDNERDIEGPHTRHHFENEPMFCSLESEDDTEIWNYSSVGDVTLEPDTTYRVVFTQVCQITAIGPEVANSEMNCDINYIGIE